MFLHTGVGAQGGEAPPADVRVATVEQRTVQPVSWMPGGVISRNHALLASELKGRLIFVAEVGDRLELGAPLARLDDRDLRLQVEVAAAEVQEVEARLVFYRSEAERLEKLAEQNNAARNRLQEVTGMRDELAGRLEAAEARVRLAQESLSKAVIAAPFAGVVSERVRYPGEQVPESGEVARLVDVVNLEVSARVPSGGILGLQEGDVLRVRNGDTEVSGVLRTLVPVGDASRLFEIRITLEATHWPVGTPVRVAVPVTAPREALVVPRDALVIRSFGINVYVIDAEDKAVMRPIEVGYGEQGWIEVTGMLQVGEAVVVRGNERLSPGRAVRILQ